MVILMGGAVALIIAVLFWLRFSAGARLSKDPRQHELARLLIRSVRRPPVGASLMTDAEGRLGYENGAPTGFLNGFKWAKDYLAQHFAGESAHSRKLRLAHALALAQTHVSPNDYDSLRIEVAHYRG